MKKIVSILCVAALVLSLMTAVSAASADISGKGQIVDDGKHDYYNAEMSKANLVDGDDATGWQYAEDLTTGTEDDLTNKPNEYYKGGDGVVYKKTTYAAGDVWFGANFNNKYAVDKLVIKWEKGSTAKTLADGGYKIQYNDGTAWKDVAATATRAEAGEVLTDTVTFSAVTGTGFRVVILAGDSKYSPKVWTYEVYGELALGDGEEEKEETPNAPVKTGVESVLPWAVVMMVAAGVVLVSKRVRA